MAACILDNKATADETTCIGTARTSLRDGAFEPGAATEPAAESADEDNADDDQTETRAFVGLVRFARFFPVLRIVCDVTTGITLRLLEVGLIEGRVDDQPSEPNLGIGDADPGCSTLGSGLGLAGTWTDDGDVTVTFGETTVSGIIEDDVMTLILQSSSDPLETTAFDVCATPFEGTNADACPTPTD